MALVKKATTARWERKRLWNDAGFVVICIGAARGASAAGIGRVGTIGAGAGTGAGGAESAPPRDGRPPIVACAATDWRRSASSSGPAGTPFAGRPVNMASMVGRSAAPNGVERKSLGSAVTPDQYSSNLGTDAYM